METFSRVEKQNSSICPLIFTTVSTCATLMGQVWGSSLSEVWSQIQGPHVLAGRKVTIIPYPFWYLPMTKTSCSFSFELNINATRKDPCEGLSSGPHAWLLCLQMAVTSSLSLPKCHWMVVPVCVRGRTGATGC